jgi:hypothetical protein
MKLVLKPGLIRNQSFPDSHAEQPRHGGAEVVEQEAVGQRQEVVDEGGDGEDQGELLVLAAAVCSEGRDQRTIKYYMPIHLAGIFI